MKVKNISGENRLLDGVLVLVGTDVDVPAERVFSLTVCSTLWAPVDEAAIAVHEVAAVEQRVAQIHADAAVGAVVDYPAEDADRTEVAAFVVVTDQAPAEDLAGLDVDALRGQFVVVAPAPAPDDVSGEPPAKNARRDVWAAYAVTQLGATEEDVEGKTRADLIEAYGAREIEGQLGATEPGPAVNAETGEVTQPGEPLPPAESDGSGEPLDPPTNEHDSAGDPADGNDDSQES